MLLTSITLCCFMLQVQSQDPNHHQLFNPDHIYFADNFPHVVPLTISGSNVKLDRDAIRRIFGEEPQKKSKGSTSVEVERSNELASSTNFEGVNNANKQNLVSREISTAIPSKETAQQIAQRHFVQNTLQLPTNSARYNSLLYSGTTPALLPANTAASNNQLYSSTTPSSLPVNLAGSNNQLYPRATPPPLPVNSAGSNSLLYSVTNFGLNLLKNVNQQGNVVVSPFSITSLLALLQQGSSGTTQDQITNALQMSSEKSASAYAQILADFKYRSSRNILKTANILFVSDAFNINSDFKEVAINSFKSDITPVSFVRTDLAARQINSWVSSRTDNKIDKLISPDALSGSTQVVLVNAIYFKGLWEVPFRVESTLPREFQLSNGQTKTAQFMRMRKLFKTGVDPTTNAKVIILPFERDQYSLMVILPSQLMSIRSTLTSLTDARLLSYLSFPALETELELPKFTARSDIDLTPVLRNMGITNMFGQYAELNGIGTYRSFSPQISSAVHSAVLSIDEHGGSAAAATAFAAVALSYDDPSVVFKANRPFLAVLWDNKRSLPLFMAEIEDPQQ